MHNNFYFLRHLTRSLEDLLKGAVISECFSQNRDELILRFETQKNSFFIRASLLPEFTCLSFPENFHRARKNSVDLFTETIGLYITSIRQFENERSFALELTESKMLLFKMHGNRSNIILFENNAIKDLFRKTIVADQNIKLQDLDRAIDWSYEYFLAHHQKIKSTYFTFGKIIWDYLEEKQFESMAPENKWPVIQEILHQLEQPVFYLTNVKAVPHLSLIKWGDVIDLFHEPIRAINAFFHTYTQSVALSGEKTALVNSIRAKLVSSENYYSKTSDKLITLNEGRHYKIWADLIMANLHAIHPGDDHVVLLNFYSDNKPIEVKLRKELSPQKNAELYYKKAKNQNIEKEHLQKTLINKQKEIEHLRLMLTELEATDDIKALRAKSAEVHKDLGNNKPAISLPYHEFEYNGYKIRVGKNAAANDELTLKHTYKDDLWLHAKDVSGSHVVIKYQSGKNVPRDVIERAAQVAAYNSKRKNESLCPVIVTSKKYVRKRKGDPPGAMVVEREKVILVEPASIN